MDRRSFLNCLAGAGLVGLAPNLAFAAAADYRQLLVLVELKGGNDGLNTVVPYADPRYFALRPKLALAPDQVLKLDARAGLHPSLAPLLPLWQAGQLAIIEGVGYAQPNLSHFRSIEIWDTASRSDQYLDDGWLSRTFRRVPVPASFAADGVVVGSEDIGPLAGGADAIVLADEERFLRQARLAADTGTPRNAAMAHILKVEADIDRAAARFAAALPRPLRTDFPPGPFGRTVKTAAEVVAGNAGVAVLRLTLAGFDTHQNQLATQANLLVQLAQGLAAFKAALEELGAWDRTLVMTYAEFGRRPQENQSGGTDHGTASVHFALGGRVRGGFYGEVPDLGRLDANGNLGFGVDFRRLYATALARWWGLAAAPILGPGHAPMEFLAA